MSDSQVFTGNETIADILLGVPEAYEILLDYGLGCVDCSMGNYESLREGVLGHGSSEETLQSIIRDLNEVKSSLGEKIQNDIEVGLTLVAAQEIQKIQKKRGLEGYGFRIELLSSDQGEPVYYFDFEAHKNKEDRILYSQGIPIFVSADTLKILNHKTVDYEASRSGGFFVL